jgi:chromosomal replication initiator protein
VEARSIDEQLTPIWDEAKAHLRDRVNNPTFRVFFERAVPVSIDGTTFTLGVASDFVRDWSEKRFGALVAEALGAVLSTPVDVRFVVDSRAEAAAQEAPVVVAPAQQPSAPRRRAQPDAEAPADVVRPPTNLNPRYTFERFVVGPHNEYASAVARSVAEAPATAYNPVFIYAGTGLGKTHLMQAIAHETVTRHPALKVKYVTCEQFTDDFISGVSEKSRVDGFKRKYRTNDILLIDDVQFLAGKEGTQVEFFHTFNFLYESGKQTVITSDRPPRELEELEERLRSRFGQGVVVDIGRPNLETRIAILRKQVKWDGLVIRDAEVLEYIASRVTTNIRELYGALTRVAGFASVHNTDVTLDVAREALKDILPKAYAMPVSVETIMAEVASQFGVHVNDLRGDKRSQDIAYPRQIAMYLARDLTDLSLPQIGERFGSRHHTTVIYAVQKIDRQLKDGHDRQLHELIQTITNRVKVVR